MEDDNASCYVKLTKEHDALVEEICPGKLNKPVQIL
jgi:hypothetical protein